MIRLTRRYRFSASHRLHSEKLTEEVNRELYGKCNNPYGHGHDYLVDVSVTGPVDAATGRAADIEALDGLVRSVVVEAFDQKYMNVEVPEFRHETPTTENVALAIRNRLERHWRSAFPGEWPKLERIRIQETPRNIFELWAEARQ
ncbi:MAG: 6-carboxytetrahydropterin synthase [Bryobacteraceae bacterium]